MRVWSLLTLVVTRTVCEVKWDEDVDTLEEGRGRVVVLISRVGTNPMDGI